MSVSHFGDYNTTETVIIPFNTFDSNDPAASVTITNLVAGDIEIHNWATDGVAQRTSDSGVTIVINADGVTGNHLASIDLSDNTDVGFYAVGERYQVRIEGTTVDGGTINAWIGAFSIGCVLRPTVDGNTLDVTATGEAGLDLDNTSGTIAAAQLGADCLTAAKIADGAFVAANFAASSLDGKGDWNTTTPPTVAAIVNEWETQSQADPTGFHVNVLEIGGTAQTANDNGLDINSISGELVKVPKSDGTATWNATALASINTEADTALADYSAPTYDQVEGFFQLALRSDAGIETDRSTLLTAINADEGSGVGNYSAQTEAQEAIRDHVGNGANLTEAGGDGDHLTAINLPNQTMDITGNLSGSVGSVTGAVGSVTGAVGSVTGNVGGSVGSISGVTFPTNFADLAITVTTGRIDVDSVSGTPQTANDNGADINAILVDTGELQTDWTNDGRLDAILDAILAMLDDARTEPGQGAPPINPDLATKVDYLYKNWRNLKDQTTTLWRLYDDAGTTVDQKATVSEAAGTATKQEIVAGP